MSSMSSTLSAAQIYLLAVVVLAAMGVWLGAVFLADRTPRPRPPRPRPPRPGRADGPAAHEQLPAAPEAAEPAVSSSSRS